MSMRHASGDLTICEVIRKINDQAQGDSKRDDEIRKRCTQAEFMAKKITAKLIEYKREKGGKAWIDWEFKNPTFEADLKRRLAEGYK